MLTSNGAGAPTFQAIAGTASNVVMFTASGTYNPSAGTLAIYVECVGGGGGGGGATRAANAPGYASGGGWALLRQYQAAPAAHPVRSVEVAQAARTPARREPSALTRALFALRR